MSHKALADLGGIGKAQVIKAIDLLLDDGLIAFMHLVPTQRGSWKRRYRVLHPSLVEAQRAAIETIGVPPSERARHLARKPSIEKGAADELERLMWDAA